MKEGAARVLWEITRCPREVVARVTLERAMDQRSPVTVVVRAGELARSRWRVLHGQATERRGARDGWTRVVIEMAPGLGRRLVPLERIASVMFFDQGRFSGILP